ncbi:hypothetical protein PIB30_078424 [Stylosanthes scabra]|uniref:Uncharacterized protein n=1 Tax=Stylosanthes scabra TaxID=79078 RepID=A0ABU6SS33_9FABA|nr:hypothetical protein [Stylosanthes scabra]
MEEEFENVCVAYSELRRANDELHRANDQLSRANQPLAAREGRVMGRGYLYPYPPHTHLTAPKNPPHSEWGRSGRDEAGRSKLPSLMVADLE